MFGPKKPRHFGYHGHQPKPPRHGKHSGGSSAGGSGGGSTSTPALPFLPPLDAFYSQSMDVYTYTQTIPPPAGNKRLSNLSCLITGSSLEGSRSRNQGSFGYTHIILVDPTVEIRDGYTLDTAAEPFTSTNDILTIPSGQTSNLWYAIFSFITTIPQLGRRKVILADRHGNPGNWPGLV
jgi:hypothetical protein